MQKAVEGGVIRVSSQDAGVWGEGRDAATSGREMKSEFKEFKRV